jgi:ribonuclease HII
MPSRALEIGLKALVAGVDEAGRGPLAGPVVAAAVILPERRVPRGIDDSKRVPPEKRDTLYARILDVAVVGVGMASVEEIDAVNIRQATFLAMRRAVDGLRQPPGHVLVDGDALPGLPVPATAVVGGDGLSLCIAAASIVAKVTRDRLMATLAEECPGYGWERNMGYGTPEHQEALARLGPTRHHRRSFAPVAQLVFAGFGLATSR